MNTKKKLLYYKVLMFVIYKIKFFNMYLINKVNDVRIIYHRTDMWKLKPCKKNACFLFIINFWF